MINPRLKSLAEKLLPHFLVARLDPIQEIVESEAKVAAARIADGQVVLDAGAGEARHRRYFTRGRYVALDSGTGDPDWDYSHLDVQADLEHLPLGSGSVDCVLCMVVLEHTRDPRRVLSEFARVLKAGGSLFLVVPFLWEEHQAPHDYLRFTRHGVRLLLENLPLRVDLLCPMGGFFWVCARRCVSLLGFFQQGWRWILFVPLAPFFGLLLPLLLYFLDPLDQNREFSLGFRVRAIKEGN
ncbi:MAG: class I SAM-dependent methyltransferase [Acidobacteriia bacterium]|nr:class I SAM-dependent methyltransferase [Terriglobia bacterium]